MKISCTLSQWLIYFIISFLLIFPGCGSTPTPLPEEGDPIIESFSADPNSISSGESSTLSWQVSDATSVSIDQGIGTVALSGSTSVSPTATTTYTLTAANTSGSVNAATTLTVDEGGEVVGYGAIEINSTPSGANIYLDGADTGQVTPTVLTNIAVDIHTIKLEKYHYKTKEDTNISVSAGETTFLNWTLTYASTETLTLQPGSAGKDAYVYEAIDHDDHNYGDNDELRVGCRDLDEFRTYLQFELSLIPADAIVTNASLSLYHDDFIGSGYFSIGLYQVTGNWEEDTITWNNQPASSSEAESFADVFETTFTSIGTWRIWQINDLVKDWWDDSINNYGIVLKPEIECSGIDRYAIFLSSDWYWFIGDNKHPKLEIDYYIP